MGASSKDKKDKKKEKKRKLDNVERSDDVGAAGDAHDDELRPEVNISSHLSKADKKKEKKAKKEDKKKRKSLNDETDADEAPATADASTISHNEMEQHDSDPEHNDDKPKKASNKSSKHASKRLERQKLMEQVPKVDEHGIAFTKLQLRRMMKRVKKGLDPVETPQEEHERLRQEAELKREEEVELAGMMVVSTKHDVEAADDGDDASHDNADQDAHEDESGAEDSEMPNAEPLRPKKKQRTKPLPSDYVCMACQNKHSPAHWIYDCPSKVRMPGTNQVAKNLRGIHNPDCKVFVSGLPFDAKQKDVLAMFEGCGKIIHCKLVQFDDTKRCKGNAYLSFESKEDTLKALKRNGMKQTLKDGKVLSLKVTKALSRALTKKGASPSPAKPPSKPVVDTIE